MPAINLKIEHLVLDGDNPRITHAAGQQEALQKVVKDQKTKLLRLAESIVEHGLNPTKRLMVLQISDKPKRYIALEGNRRVTVLRLLSNPAAMSGLDMPDNLRRAFERLASVFNKSEIEPIEAYEVASREDGRYWIELEHNGEDEGRGIVGWKPVVAARFRKREPAIQALDLVLEHGGLTEQEAQDIRSKFSLTTLRRVVETQPALALLGLSVKDGQLRTNLAASEVIKPLRRLVREIAEKKVTSRSFNKGDDIVKHLSSFGRPDKADLSKKTTERPIEGIQKSEFASAPRPPKPRPNKPTSERPNVVPKSCSLNVTDSRLGEIYNELRTLKLADSRNAVSVLLRVFLELSVDHFLEAKGVDLHHAPDPKSGKKPWKTLDKKLAETVGILVNVGVPAAHFAAVTQSVSNRNSPMHTDLFHRYVHDRFQTPLTTDLIAAWNNAQPLFEKIWP